MKRCLLLLVLVAIMVVPVMAETGSTSVLVDPNNFVSVTKVKSEIIGTMADVKEIANIQPFPFGLKEVLRITLISGKNYAGVSAQDIQKIMPELVYQNPDMVRYVKKGFENTPFGMQYTAPSGTDTLSVDMNGIIAALINAIQEQQVTITNQQKEIDDLTKRMDALEAKVGI